MALILGIESSCDETAAAIVRDGEQQLSSVVASQLAHQQYGGVVPEIAAREHLRAIAPVVRKALADATVKAEDLDAVAVTQGPGLAGALLVGISYAKAMAFALDKPLIAVNHLEGHIHAVLLEQRQAGNHQVDFPVLSLVVSGGHTHLYLCEQTGTAWTYDLIGRTRDDAAGEAFDKVAKLLALGYPGGPVIDRLSRFGDSRAVKFAPVQIKGEPRKVSKRYAQAGKPVPQGSGQNEESVQQTESHDFSYSGMKTAVLRYVETNGMREAIEQRRTELAKITKPTIEDFRRLTDQHTIDLVASFQRAMVEDVVAKTMAAARETSTATLLVTGGVAANSELRSRFEQASAEEGVRVFFPSLKLSTDNAAMIAAAAYPKFLAGEFADAEMSAEAGLSLR
jgi:N6-L-threonylcarbamoyladenine synthase